MQSPKRHSSKRPDEMERELASLVKSPRMAQMLRVLFRICKVDFKVTIYKRECRTNLRVNWILNLTLMLIILSHRRELADWIRSWLLMRLFPKSKRKPWVQLLDKTLFIMNQLSTSEISRDRLWPSPRSSSTYGPRSARWIVSQTLSIRITWIH